MTLVSRRKTLPVEPASRPITSALPGLLDVFTLTKVLSSTTRVPSPPAPTTRLLTVSSSLPLLTRSSPDWPALRPRTTRFATAVPPVLIRAKPTATVLLPMRALSPAPGGPIGVQFPPLNQLSLLAPVQSRFAAEAAATVKQAAKSESENLLKIDISNLWLRVGVPIL